MNITLLIFGLVFKNSPLGWDMVDGVSITLNFCYANIDCL